MWTDPTLVELSVENIADDVRWMTADYALRLPATPGVYRIAGD